MGGTGIILHEGIGFIHNTNNEKNTSSIPCVNVHIHYDCLPSKDYPLLACFKFHPIVAKSMDFLLKYPSIQQSRSPLWPCEVYVESGLLKIESHDIYAL